MQQNPQRAAIYCRVSTTGQAEDGSSLSTQEQGCRDYADAQGFTVDPIHVYLEVFSGAQLWERPQLTALREAVRTGAVEAVIVYAIDRLSRDPVHLGVIVSEAEHHGVEYRFMTEPLDTSPEGQLIQYVRGYAAKIERMKIVERSMRGKLDRIRNGKIHGSGTDLYGYRRDKETGKRTIHEPEAAVVRMVFRWVGEEGVAIRDVIRRLNDASVPTGAVGKRTFKDGRTPRWGKGAIGRLLRKPAYKGLTIELRMQPARPKSRTYVERPADEQIILPDGTTPAIVSSELWEAVARHLSANQGAATRNQARPYLLRGMIRCAVCKKAMYTSPEHNLRVYRCSSREKAGGACGGKRVNADYIEAEVWAEIEAILRDPKLATREIERRRKAGPKSSLRHDRAAAARALEKLEKQQERLIRRFRESDDDAFPWELVEREISALEAEKKAARALLDEAEERLAAEAATMTHLAELQVYIEHIAENLDHADLEGKRDALEALGIVVYANGRDWWIDGLVKTGRNVGDVSHSSANCARRLPRLPDRA